MKKLRVCITGGSFVNKGAEAMVLTVRDKLLSSFPEIDIYMRVKPPYFKLATQSGFIPVNSEGPDCVVSKIMSKARSLLQYMSNDAIIDVGGYQFGDPWGWKLAKKRAQAIKYCNMFNTKTIFMPQAWGPFAQKEFLDYIPEILDKSTFFIRDKKSFKEVQKIYTIFDDVLQHDIAWGFDAENTNIDNILERYGIREDVKTVCVTPNLRVYERQGSDYIDYLSVIIDVLVKRNIQVILLGHELRLDKESDDRYLCNLLSKKHPAAINVDEFLSAKEVKTIIGLSGFILSSRFHALIAALSQNIPAIAIGWSHKYSELLSDVGLPNNIMEVSKKTNAIDDYLSGFIDNIDCQSEILAKSIPGIKKNSSQMLDKVVQIIRGF